LRTGGAHFLAMKQVIGWVVVALITLFVAFNLQRADVWFFGFRAQMPIAFVVIASVILGAAGTYAFTTLQGIKKSKQAKKT
jgi:uncharacterized integral membrane protein